MPESTVAYAKQETQDIQNELRQDIQNELRMVKVNGKPLFSGPDINSVQGKENAVLRDLSKADFSALGKDLTHGDIPRLDAAINAFKNAVGLQDDLPKGNKILGDRTRQALLDIAELSAVTQIAQNSIHITPDGKARPATANDVLDARDEFGRGDSVASRAAQIKEEIGHDVNLAQFGITGGNSVETHGGTASVATAKPDTKSVGRGGNH